VTIGLRELAVLLAWLWPPRGRHCGHAAAAAAVPDEPAPDDEDEDEDVSADGYTRFDLPVGKPRPYVLPATPRTPRRITR
jgi:hypothetical protein